MTEFQKIEEGEDLKIKLDSLEDLLKEKIEEAAKIAQPKMAQIMREIIQKI